MAQPSVSTSPMLIDERSGRRPTMGLSVEARLLVEAGAVNSRIPMNARAAAVKMLQLSGRAPGGRSAGIEEKSGTSTTIRPVMNADFDGVVRARPVVWNWYPA